MYMMTTIGYYSTILEPFVCTNTLIKVPDYCMTYKNLQVRIFKLIVSTFGSHHIFLKSSEPFETINISGHL